MTEILANILHVGVIMVMLVVAYLIDALNKRIDRLLELKLHLTEDTIQRLETIGRLLYEIKYHHYDKKEDNNEDKV